MFVAVFVDTVAAVARRSLLREVWAVVTAAVVLCVVVAVFVDAAAAAVVALLRCCRNLVAVFEVVLVDSVDESVA
jgi:hypothetical protein